MYGGGFATIPAYLRDLFGTVQVGAIHGALLTAWSAAGVAGPVLVNYIRQYQIDARRRQSRRVLGHDVHHGGAAGRRASSATALVKPLDERHYVKTGAARSGSGKERT